MRAPRRPRASRTAATCCSRSRTCRCGFGGVKALTDVSFDIRKGEIRAIIGPNGAGKTSMLNCINGFYHPTRRPHHLQGREAPEACARHAAARGGIARTFQNVALFKGMSTLDNIMAGRPEDALGLLLAAAAATARR